MASASAEPGQASHRLSYRPALDGMRGVAITLVILGHIAFFLVPAWNGRFFRSGFLGVDVFFVLSGFLITTLLLERHRRERHPIGRFYVRRALRLLPALLGLLTANLVLAVVFDENVANALRSFAVALTYTTNWAELNSINIPEYVVHFWSLAIEGQFYLVWSVVLFGLMRLGVSRRHPIFMCSTPPSSWPSGGHPCGGPASSGCDSTSGPTCAPIPCR